MAPTGRARGWAALILVLYAALVAVAFVIPRPIDRGFTPWLRGVVAQVQRHVAPSWFDYEFVNSLPMRCCSCRSGSCWSSRPAGG